MFSWNYAQQFKNKLSMENSLLRTSSDSHPKKDIVELKKGCERQKDDQNSCTGDDRNQDLLT